MTDTRHPGERWRGMKALDGANVPTSRRLGDGCLSDLQLDRLHLGELAPQEQRTAHAHLASCGPCGEAHAALTSLAVDFPKQVDLASLAVRTLEPSANAASPGWFRRWRLPVGLSTAAALGALLLVARPETSEMRTRTKGAGFSLTTYVQHAESEAPPTLHLGEPLHPRDQVQFRYSGTEGGHLIVLSADQTGQVAVYYPPGPSAAAVSAGRDVPLATAVELDDSLGVETVVALRCPAAVTVEQAQQALARAIERAGAGKSPAALGLACDEHRQRLTKVAPAR